MKETANCHLLSVLLKVIPRGKVSEAKCYFPLLLIPVSRSLG